MYNLLFWCKMCSQKNFWYHQINCLEIHWNGTSCLYVTSLHQCYKHADFVLIPAWICFNGSLWSSEWKWHVKRSKHRCALSRQTVLCTWLVSKLLHMCIKNAVFSNAMGRRAHAVGPGICSWRVSQHCCVRNWQLLILPLPAVSHWCISWNFFLSVVLPFSHICCFQQNERDYCE